MDQEHIVSTTNFNSPIVIGHKLILYKALIWSIITYASPICTTIFLSLSLSPSMILKCELFVFFFPLSTIYFIISWEGSFWLEECFLKNIDEDNLRGCCLFGRFCIVNLVLNYMPDFLSYKTLFNCTKSTCWLSRTNCAHVCKTYTNVFIWKKNHPRFNKNDWP